MKKLCMFMVFVCLCAGLFSQRVSLGGGVIYTTGFKYESDITMIKGKSFNSSNLGINIKSVFDIGSPYSISVTYNYLFPSTATMVEEKVEKKITISSSMVDVDGRYTFINNESMQVYAFAGLDVSLVGFKYVDKSPSLEEEDVFVVFENKSHDNYMGLNVGAGFSLNVAENLDFYLDAKCLAMHYFQFVIGSGILYHF